MFVEEMSESQQTVSWVASYRLGFLSHNFSTVVTLHYFNDFCYLTMHTLDRW